MVLERIANGDTLKAIGAAFGVSRPMLNNVLRENPERQALAQAARRESAHAHVEDALEIADNVPPVREEIQKAQLRTGLKMALAAKLDRDEYGEKPAPLVQINLGQLHLTALKELSVAHQPLMLPAAVVESGDD